MDIHKNARLTPIGRERLVRQVASGQAPEAAARDAGVCPRTVRTWLARFAAEGVAGLQDRSSRPQRLHRPTPTTAVARIEALRDTILAALGPDRDRTIQEMRRALAE